MREINYFASDDSFYNTITLSWKYHERSFLYTENLLYILDAHIAFIIISSFLVNLLISIQMGAFVSVENRRCVPRALDVI